MEISGYVPYLSAKLTAYDGSCAHKIPDSDCTPVVEQNLVVVIGNFSPLGIGLTG